jgi:hypothetical protein
VTVHNQCSNIELVSPVWFDNGVICSKLADQQMNVGTAMKAYFEIYATQDEFEGALLFRLQRYPNGWHSVDTLTTEVNKEAMHAYILLVWKTKNSELFVYATLVERAKEFTWDEDKLKKLYHENHSQIKKYDDATSYKWFINDNVALKMSSKANDFKRKFELSISISEEEKEDADMKLLCKVMHPAVLNRSITTTR